MKFLRSLLLFVLVFSCRGEDLEEVQKIDQVLKIYIKNSVGADLLSKETAGSFYSVELKDLSAIRDRVAVAATSKKDTAGINYLEYIAGATRVLEANSTDSHKIYKSDLAVQYKSAADADIVEDRMQIYYDYTPSVFQINSIVYNDVKIFTKTDGQPNIITVVK